MTHGAAIAGESRHVDVLAGTTWLLVSRDLTWADGVARALRAHGARVNLLDLEGHGLARLSEADAQVLLFAEEPCPEALRSALSNHAGLRFAAQVVVRTEQVWPPGRAMPDLDALMRECGRALRLDREVRTKAAAGQSLTLELSEVGLPRALRALSRLQGSFVVQLSPRDADAYVALADGQWIGASYKAKGPQTPRLDGMAALRQALTIRHATCMILPASNLRTPAWKQPLDLALAHALAGANEAEQASLHDEPTRPAASTSGILTARGVGPPPSVPPHRPSARPEGQRRGTSALLAAALGVGGALAATTLVWTAESTEPPLTPAGHVSEPAPTPSIALPRAPTGVKVEPLAASPAGDDDAPTAEATGEAGPFTLPEDPDAENEAGSWPRSRRLSRRADRADDPAHARELYLEALRNDPRNPHAVVGLAQLARRAGALDEALQLAERAVALRDGRLSYRLLHAELLLEAGRAGEALGAFEAAEALRPGAVAPERGKRRALSALHGQSDDRP